MEPKFIPKEEYKKILELMPIPCVDLIIIHNKKILLVKRKDEPGKDWWWIPGGRIFKNETLEQAAIRKAKEETGLDIRVEKKLTSYEFFYSKSTFGELKSGGHTISVVFLCKPINPNQEIILDNTSKDFKWIDEIEEDFHPILKSFLKESKIFN